MPYAPLSYAELLDQLLTDYRNRVPGADTRVDSEIYVRCAVTAGVVWQVMHGVRWIEDQIFPTSADHDNLLRHAANYDMTPADPGIADDGTITLSGTNGTVVASGLALAHEDGVTFTTTSGGTIALGVLAVTATADDGGAEGNKSVGQTLTVQSPPVGVDSEAEVTTAFTNGTDAETDAQLLVRLLLRMREGNAGGTAIDYEQWALEVAGVVFATCLPLRRGAGTVDVAVFQADGDGNRIAAGPTLRAEVLAHLNAERPVTADVGVPELDEVVQDLELSGMVLADGLELSDVQALVEDAYGDLVRSVVAGGTLYRVQIIRAIGGIEGIYTFDVDVPATDVVSTVDPTTVEFFSPGTVTLS